VTAAHLIAPYATILIAVTPADTQIQDDAASQVAPPEMMEAVEDIAAGHLANVISVSDGTGESTYSYGAEEITAQTPGELAAAAQGIAFVDGTGDCGVVQNLAVANGQCADTTATPATATWDDSPWVTAVAGSVPNLSDTGKRLGPDPLWSVDGTFSGGAGFSEVFARPWYQDAVDHDPMREVPDITMDAGSGTSEATPLFAGVLALATQLNHGANVGPVNPALYLALGPAGAKDGIADVVSGNNSVVSNGRVVVRGFSAGPGYDIASGWGTVYAPRFVPSLVANVGLDVQARAAARAWLTALEHTSIQLTRTADGRYLAAAGFLPGHPVRLYVNGTRIATLTANALGDVTDLLRATTGIVTLRSMLITETASL
jgi:subtilase family serine protease